MTLQLRHNTAVRAEWEKTSELLDIFHDDPADIIAFIEHCDAADLHMFTTLHGIEPEIEIFAAILTHPLCDRATALQIFHMCDPYYYEQELSYGRKFEQFTDEEDRVFIAILKMAHKELCKRPAWRAKFDCPALTEWQSRPDCSPALFSNWPLPAAVLAPSENKVPQASIAYTFSTIRLRFETWATRQ